MKCSGLVCDGYCIYLWQHISSSSSSVIQLQHSLKLIHRGCAFDHELSESHQMWEEKSDTDSVSCQLWGCEQDANQLGRILSCKLYCQLWELWKLHVYQCLAQLQGILCLQIQRFQRSWLQFSRNRRTLCAEVLQAWQLHKIELCNHNTTLDHHFHHHFLVVVTL